VQPLYERALQEAVRCKGVSILDVCNIVGPVTEMMAVYDYILAHAHEFGQELVPHNWQVFLANQFCFLYKKRMNYMISTREVCELTLVVGRRYQQERDCVRADGRAPTQRICT